MCPKPGNMLHIRYCIIDALPCISSMICWFLCFCLGVHLFLNIHLQLMHKGGGRECYSGICVILVATKLIKMQPLQIGQYTVNVMFLMDYKKKKTHDRAMRGALTVPLLLSFKFKTILMEQVKQSLIESAKTFNFTRRCSVLSVFFTKLNPIFPQFVQTDILGWFLDFICQQIHCGSKRCTSSW